MLNSLRFVMGAVAKQGATTELQHFRIKDGRVSGFNGSFALSCPIDLNLDVMPKATTFVKAIQTCTETVSLHVTAAKKLAIKSGPFKAFIECADESINEVKPEGTHVALAGGFTKVLKTLLPFVAEDGPHPWAKGILFKGNSAFATNNVILLEYWLGYNFPIALNIPKSAVVELVRIGEDPIGLQWTENSVTFHFEGEKWLRTQTYSTVWPDLAKILDKESQQAAVPSGVWNAVTSLMPFTDDMERLFFTPGRITTVAADEVGASVDIPDLNCVKCFNAKHFKMLEPLIETIDLVNRPSLFFGDGVRGAIIEMRG